MTDRFRYDCAEASCGERNAANGAPLTYTINRNIHAAKGAAAVILAFQRIDS